MFKVMGRIKILAKVTYLPVRKDNPQSNSIDFAKGIKYVEATKPTLKALKFPVASGSGASFKKKLTDANNNKSPIRLRIMIIVIFIVYYFRGYMINSIYLSIAFSSLNIISH